MNQYPSALGVTLRATAAAYGYALTLGATVAALVSRQGSPNTVELFLFVAGGLAAFAVLEILLQLMPAREEETPEHSFPFAGALNFLSVGLALAGAIGVTQLVSSAVAWALASLVSTVLYMLLVAAQVTVVAIYHRS